MFWWRGLVPAWRGREPLRGVHCSLCVNSPLGGGNGRDEVKPTFGSQLRGPGERDAEAEAACKGSKVVPTSEELRFKTDMRKLLQHLLSALSLEAALKNNHSKKSFVNRYSSSACQPFTETVTRSS